MSEKRKLQPGWEAVWTEDFDILPLLGPRAWLLCLYMRTRCDHETRLLENFSELDLQRKYGWDPKNTRRLLKKLVDNGFIVPQGYLKYLVRTWTRLSTDSGKRPDPTPFQTRVKSPTTSGKMPDPPRAKCPTTSGKMPDPLYADKIITDKIRQNEKVSPVDNFDQATPGLTAKTLKEGTQGIYKDGPSGPSNGPLGAPQNILKASLGKQYRVPGEIY